MTSIFETYNYLTHWLTARHTLGYNVHSPYLYDFTRNVIYEDNPYYCYKNIENLRRKLLNNNRIVFVQDFGTRQSGDRTVSYIARTSLAQPKEAQLLFRIANYAHAGNILELGTSLGITTAYLAAHDSRCRVTTLEGSPELAKIAEDNWRQLNLKQQITPVTGNIDETLTFILKEQPHFDLVYFDANHSYEATTRYFRLCLPHKDRNSIFIFDDIYHTPEMHRAWQDIKLNEQVTATINLYHLGLVFFNSHLIKKHYKMRF